MLALTIARVAQTIIYLHIYILCTYYEISIVLFYLVYTSLYIHLMS